jgi:hypothetical protein
MKKEEINQKEEQKIAPVEYAGVDLPKSKQRIKKRYPDRSFENDDEWENAFNETLDEYETTIEKGKISEKAITDYISQYPEFEDILVDMIVNKLPPAAALSRNIDLDEFIPQEGDDGYDDYIKAGNERLEKNKKISAEKEEMDRNEAESDKVIDAFVAEHNLNDEQLRELLDYGFTDFKNLLMRKITAEMLENWNKALNHDNDVSAAEEAGLTNGRNEQIEKSIKKEEMKKRGDGLPAGVGGTSNEDLPGSESVFENALKGSRIDFNKIAKKV